MGDIARHCDLVPAPEAATTARLDDVIDPNLLIFEEELCLRSRVDHPSQLQELAQTDGVIPDGYSTHRGDAIGFGATLGRVREVPICASPGLDSLRFGADVLGHEFWREVLSCVK